MPREKKKRGRREEARRRRLDSPEQPPWKRAKVSSSTEEKLSDAALAYREDEPEADFIALEPDTTGQMNASHFSRQAHEPPFYGLLDEEEQSYYAGVNSKLELDDFESEDERNLFLEAVYRESAGKELKIACSQSCSRHLERVILVSAPSQLKAIFKAFQGHFLHLVQHRFASHCCETLFLQCAPLIAQRSALHDDENSAEGEQSLESLFLRVVDELEPDIGYLLTEKFASHVIRVLLVILSGEPLNAAHTKAVLASRKKEKIDHLSPYSLGDENSSESRKVPDSFKHRLGQLRETALLSLNTTYIRALATHPTGNPVLQLLLQIEASQYQRSRSSHDLVVLHQLLPDSSFEDGSENTKFVLGLLYDPTGSRLLEVIVQRAPGKIFKKLYAQSLKPRIVSMIKNDVSSYVAIRVFQRLGKDELQAAIHQILPHFQMLVERHRVAVIAVLVERCVTRGIDPQPLASALQSAYGDDAAMLPRMLKLDVEPDVTVEKASKMIFAKRQYSTQTRLVDPHGTQLAQTLCGAAGFANIFHSAITAISPALVSVLCKDPIASRLLQDALTSSQSSKEFRRQFVPTFYGHIGELSVDPSGSHVIDALWSATSDLYFLKERILEELLAHEKALRESRFGRAVWRNWKLDMYNTKRKQWVVEAKGFANTSRPQDGEQNKSALELARERFVAKQKQQPQ